MNMMISYQELVRTFLSTPLSKPDKFHSDALNMGFSLQWRY